MITCSKNMRNLGRENGNFFIKNVIQKSRSAKFFPVPPNSAPGLRLWVNKRKAYVQWKIIENKRYHDGDDGGNREERSGGRPSREWLDDTKDWCQTHVHSLSL